MFSNTLIAVCQPRPLSKRYNRHDPVITFMTGFFKVSLLLNFKSDFACELLIMGVHQFEEVPLS
jgi:hypothetical protein